MSALRTTAHQAESNYIFQGREVTFPVVVRDAASASATYLVPTDRAGQLLPGEEFELVELLPGRALFSIACIDYRDNDLGDYNEVSLALFVREKGRPTRVPYLGTLFNLLRNRVSTYITWLPVDQSFTRDAGAGIWGFPKTVEQIDFEIGDATAVCSLSSGGQHVLTMSMPRAGKRNLPEAEMTTYSHIDGIAHKTRFVSRASGVSIALGSGKLELGDHPAADQLRTLGLPKKPLIGVWMEHMHATFDRPEEL